MSTTPLFYAAYRIHCHAAARFGIIRRVKTLNLHGWDLTIPEARALQVKLARKVIRAGQIDSPRLVAGVDISCERDGRAAAAVVVLSYPELEEVETRILECPIKFPYVTGLLSFRESPLILAACAQLTCEPDLFLVDGQGIAHPRRFGIAAHLGLLLDRPTIGCAKSRLTGDYEEPGQAAGSYTRLTDNGEEIGSVLRTRRGCRPIFVSIGNKMDLETATGWALRCCRGYRLPEPTRLAHIAAGRKQDTRVLDRCLS